MQACSRTVIAGAGLIWVWLSLGVRQHRIMLCTYLDLRYCHPAKYKWTVTKPACYSSSTFDEKLHEHISLDLADNVGRESDPS
jgi:hypothetical protein